MPTTLTHAMLERLRAAYATVDAVDPSLPAYARLRALLDGMTQAQLRQLAGAGIKFVSRLAANRVTATATAVTASCLCVEHRGAPSLVECAVGSRIAVLRDKLARSAS